MYPPNKTEDYLVMPRGGELSAQMRFFTADAQAGWTNAAAERCETATPFGTPVDPEVLDCVKRDANIWLFAAPVGGDVRLNRALVFRRLSSAAVRP